MIEIKNLSFGYNRRRSILKNFSLQITDGNVIGLLGKNGTGKSTLLYLLTGLLRPNSGSILYNGHDTSLRLPSVLQDMFLVPEEFTLPPIDIMQYAEINAPFYPKFSYEQLEACLKVFEMPTDRKLSELSMGQKKKVYICFALATNTRLLFMDEPTNGLDIPSKSRFRKAVAMGMNDERTIIISTHQVRDIDTLLDRVIIIDDNDILLDAGMNSIGEKLFFAEQETTEPTDGAIYVQPSMQGNSVIYPNTHAEESTINTELLFNAALFEKEAIKKIFCK